MWASRKFPLYHSLRFLSKKTHCSPKLIDKNAMSSIVHSRSLVSSTVFLQKANVAAAKPQIYDGRKLFNMFLNGEAIDKNRITPLTLCQALGSAVPLPPPQQDTLLSQSSTKIVDVMTGLAQKTFNPCETDEKALLVSFGRLKILDKKSDGKLFQTVGEEKICSLINAMLDLVSSKTDSGKSVLDRLLPSLRHFVLKKRIQSPEIHKKLQMLVDEFIDECVHRNNVESSNNNQALKLLGDAYSRQFLPLPVENPERIDQILAIMLKDGSTTNRIFDDILFSWFHLLDTFHTAGLGAKVSGAQLDAWLACWKRKMGPSGHVDVIQASRLLRLCIKLDRADLLEQEKTRLIRFIQQDRSEKEKLEDLRLLQESKLEFKNDPALRDELIKLLSEPQSQTQSSA